MTTQPLPGTLDGTCTVTREEHVAWIVLDRPDRRNALSPAMWAALPGLLQDLDADPAVRVIGLRGAGRTGPGKTGEEQPASVVGGPWPNRPFRHRDTGGSEVPPPHGAADGPGHRPLDS